MKYEKPYEYKRKGNEEQAGFNVRVNETIAEAESEMATTRPVQVPALQRALDSLKKGQKPIVERYKLIRLADRSEDGWNLVDEYTADTLATGVWGKLAELKDPELRRHAQS